MANTPSTLRGKRIPKSISKPTETAEAVAVVVESVVALPLKASKAHKSKLVRDSFTMPKDEYQVLGGHREVLLRTVASTRTRRRPSMPRPEASASRRRRFRRPRPSAQNRRS